jgi:hypothetical protein
MVGWKGGVGIVLVEVAGGDEGESNRGLADERFLVELYTAYCPWLAPPPPDMLALGELESSVSAKEGDGDDERGSS